MFEKIFPLDKNYLLRQAQFELEERHLDLMVDELRLAYTRLFNPLRLQEKTYQKIISHDTYPKDRIQLIYRQLCGIYRYQKPDNQLEILFDGISHLEKFKLEWDRFFLATIRDLGTSETYIKTMLRMTLLYETESMAEWSENQCKFFINQKFGTRIIKRYGHLILKVG